MQIIITTPDNSANLNTALPPNEEVPLAFPIVVKNTMQAGQLSGHTFTALIDGAFRFNISSQAEIVEDYEVRLVHERANTSPKGYSGYGTASRNSEGQADKRIAVSKDITLDLKAGDTVKLFDIQVNSGNGAHRWAYDGTNRIEISLAE